MSCAKPSSYDLSSSVDRASLELDVKQALTAGDCATAIALSTQLYNSSYSDNTARMLYASAQGCNAGINLFELLNDISSSNFSTGDAIFRALVRLFPSTSADSRMVSSWYAQDALQSILNNGAVVGASDQIIFNANNTGSDIVTDRTIDSSTYLLFISMAEIGTILNRYGYATGQTPISQSYAQGQNLAWTTTSSVQSDTTGTACALASAFFNMFDAIAQVTTYVSSNLGSQLSSISSVEGAFNTYAAAGCTAGGFTSSQCTAAITRIRYRGACSEQAAAAAVASGVVNFVNYAWSGP